MNISSSKKESIGLSLILASAIALLNSESVRAFNITFNYDYDDINNGGNGFFSGADGTTRRNTLEQAGQYFTSYINDNLSAISLDPSSTTGIGYEWSPGFVNTWTASFFNPSTGNNENIKDLTVLENEIVIYAGGRDLNSLGVGGTGSSSLSIITSNGNVVNQDFVDLINGRGQAGALTDPATDIGLWGGSIAFDTNINFNSNNYAWHNEVSSDGLDSNEFDFLSVAIHELGHVLGFGGDSWNNQVAGTTFTGSNSITAYNLANDPDVSAVPLQNGSPSHWLDGTTALTVAGASQEAALDPIIANGQRKILTNLDYAGLADVGWEVEQAALEATVPFEFSPAFGIFLTCGWFGLSSIFNRLKRNNPKSKV